MSYDIRKDNAAFFIMLEETLCYQACKFLVRFLIYTYIQRCYSCRLKKGKTLMKKIMCICLVAIMLLTGLKNSNSFTGMEKSIKDTTQKSIKTAEETSDSNIEAALQLYNGERYFDNDKIEERLKEEKELKNHIVWCVPTLSADTDVISSEKLKKINDYLSHKYNCYMDILYVTDDAEGSYNKGILSYLDKKYADVFFSGFTYDENDYNAYENLIKNNYAYDMADDLKQQKNASLYSAFNENEWVGMEKDGHVFAIPNQNFLPHRCYAAFKKDKFTKSEIKNLPNNIEDTLSCIETKNIGKNQLLWDISYYDILNSVGLCDMGGLWFSHTDGNVKSTFDDERLKSIIKSLNNLYNKNIISGNISLNDYEVETLGIINQKEKDIAFFADNATAENLKDDYYIKSFKYYYKTYDYSNTMINAKSDKHSQSMFVIDKVLNDKKVAVLLVNGVKNKDFKLINGYAYDIDGNEMPSNYIRTVFGVSDNVYNAESSDFGKDWDRSKKEYFNSENCNISYINGYMRDYRNTEDFEELYIKLDELCESADFEKDYKKAVIQSWKREKNARSLEIKNVKKFLLDK